MLVACAIVRAMIPAAESLTVEFKSDRTRLPDQELVTTVVCLANTEGGDLYLGVENDGRVTGLHAEHQNVSGVTALIANRTRPSQSVRVELLQEDGGLVARILVPKAQTLVATSEGVVQRRRLQADGAPQCVPMYPYEFDRRESDLGRLDYSVLPIEHASVDEFDPLERERLRQTIEQNNGDRALLALTNEELDGALGLTRRTNGSLVPTVAGLLILGREAALREHLPTHEIAFQVLDGTEVRLNNFYHGPLLRTYEQIEQQFSARNEERELLLGLFRVPVPAYGRSAFREALANAVIHRDYTRLGAIHVQWFQSAIEISNPGGFIEGVTLANLLVTPLRPRNPLLADVFKRIGLVERTGRGVDIIYQGLLRYGRPAPNYGRTNATSVIVVLPGGEADLSFLQIVIEEEQRTHRSPLPVDSLVALRALRDGPQVDAGTLAKLIQKDQANAGQVLERLVEAGLAEARGSRNGRVYQLSAAVYRKLGAPAAYVRRRGFEPFQQEQMVLQYVQIHGRITRSQVAELCKISSAEAKRLLARLAGADKLMLRGNKRTAYYEPGP
ncbi:MAG: ATP-binding protein [Dehalococcoidia bacterium]